MNKEQQIQIDYDIALKKKLVGNLPEAVAFKTGWESGYTKGKEDAEREIYFSLKGRRG